MTRCSLRYDARRTIRTGELTAEVLREQELRVDTHRTGEDILSRQMNGDRVA